MLSALTYEQHAQVSAESQTAHAACCGTKLEAPCQQKLPQASVLNSSAKSCLLLWYMIDLGRRQWICHQSVKGSGIVKPWI